MPSVAHLQLLPDCQPASQPACQPALRPHECCCSVPATICGEAECPAAAGGFGGAAVVEPARRRAARQRRSRPRGGWRDGGTP